jgi:hypothetical protein
MDWRSFILAENRACRRKDIRPPRGPNWLVVGQSPRGQVGIRSAREMAKRAVLS